MNLRIGFGTDLHRLVEERKLWIGGVLIESPKGGLGHSLADALSDAIIDAILGASGNRDIGFHFPETDPELNDIAGTEMLRQVMELISDSFVVINLDTVVHLESPKLSPYIPKIKKVLAGILRIKEQEVNIKAKTAEGLGDIGKGNAYKAEAIVLLQKIEKGN